MEGLKQMSLRKSLFVIIIVSIFIGIIPYYLLLFFITKILDICLCSTHFAFLNWLIPFVIAVSIPILASVIFYRIKLKKPISQLNMGAKRIMENDLDFSVEIDSKDELGELCKSFEAMRVELLQNNKELWQKMEERKQLNAAFAHDLRNPVTVLKGSTKMLQKELEQDDFSIEDVQESASLIAQYVDRIENYILLMTSVQKLEELTFAPKEIDWLVLVKKLENSVSILGSNAQKEIEFISSREDRKISVDSYMIHNVVENLIGNALRYSKEKIMIDMIYNDEEIKITILDDGEGFSPIILEKGIVPFLRGDSLDEEHNFGMGLYICQLLCEKHGGNLILDNYSNGAKVTVTFYF